MVLRGGALLRTMKHHDRPAQTWERKEYGSEYQAGTQGGLVNPQSD